MILHQYHAFIPTLYLSLRSLSWIAPILFACSTDHFESRITAKAIRSAPEPRACSASTTCMTSLFDLARFMMYSGDTRYFSRPTVHRSSGCREQPSGDCPLCSCLSTETSLRAFSLKSSSSSPVYHTWRSSSGAS